MYTFLLLGLGAFLALGYLHLEIDLFCHVFNDAPLEFSSNDKGIGIRFTVYRCHF